MNHKDYKTINMWLKDLREKDYVTWIYSTDFTEKTKPAIYYLGINGIRLLKTKNYSIDELRKRYRESTRSQTYIDRCLLLADCRISLKKANQANAAQPKYSNIRYFCELEAEYQDGYYKFITESDLVKPHMCFCKDNYETNEAVTEQSYMLEVFDATLPRYRVRKRLKNYIEYLEDEEWQSDTENENPPIALFVCATKADLIYCKRATKKLLEDSYEDGIRMRFTTADKLRAFGVLGKIWEEVVAVEDED